MTRWTLYWTVVSTLALIGAVMIAWASPAASAALFTVALAGWAVA